MSRFFVVVICPLPFYRFIFIFLFFLLTKMSFLETNFPGKVKKKNNKPKVFLSEGEHTDDRTKN